MIFDENNFPKLPQSWRALSVADASEPVSVLEKVQQKAYERSGSLAVVDQGAGLIGGYTSEEAKQVTDQLPVVVFGDHTRALKFVDFPFAAGADGIKVLRPKAIYLPQLFFRFLQAVRLPDKGYARHFQYLRTARLPVPPLAEQSRISVKLEAVLQKLGACRERLDRVPQILKKFREAVLEAAVSGKLTEEWRANSPPQAHLGAYPTAERPNDAEVLPDGWNWHAIGDLSARVSDGVHKKPDYLPSGIPFITVKDLTAGPGIDFSNTRFISQADHDEFIRRTHPEKGDLLVSKDGTLGVIRLIDTDRPFSIFVSVALIKLKDKSLAEYMRIALEAPVVQKQMVGVGSGLQHIHLQDLRKDVAPLPPPAEQKEIVRRVAQLFGRADNFSRRYEDVVAGVEQLTPSVLAKAFGGELVPQDSNDEPAEEMLERMRVEGSTDGVSTKKIPAVGGKRR